jgi:hypothetical protein
VSGHQFAGLTTGVPYGVDVYAVAANGDAAPPDTGVLPPLAHAAVGVPLPRPAGLRFAGATETGLTLAWTAALPAGGTFRLSYTATGGSGGGGGEAGSQACAYDTAAAEQSCSLAGLSPGAVYAVTVRSALGGFEDPRGAGPAVASPAAPPPAARLCFLDRTEVRGPHRPGGDNII